MRRLLVLIIIITSIALGGPVLAQPAPGSSGGAQPGGMAPGMSPRGGRSAAKATVILIRAYNPQTVTTVKGRVESLGTFPPQYQWVGVIRTAVLKTEQGKITVYLAPDSFLQEQKISLKTGDELAATGSKVTLGQEPAVIAKDVTVGGKTVTLRDDRGYPVWLEAGSPGGPPAK